MAKSEPTERYRRTDNGQYTTKEYTKKHPKTIVKKLKEKR